MAKRIVQMLVTCAVERDVTREELRDVVQGALNDAIVAEDIVVELIESRPTR